MSVNKKVHSDNKDEAELTSISRKNPFLHVKKKDIEENVQAVNLPAYDKNQASTAINASNIQSVESYISPEISHVLTYAVGVIIQSIKDGITKTEFVLNADNFKDSMFYGAKIVVEENKAISANNFNIRLISQDQNAINLFNNNADLMFAYFERNKTRFGFSVNKLKAEYDTNYLIKRKENISEEGDLNG